MSRQRRKQRRNSARRPWWRPLVGLGLLAGWLAVSTRGRQALTAAKEQTSKARQKLTAARPARTTTVAPPTGAPPGATGQRPRGVRRDTGWVLTPTVWAVDATGRCRWGRARGRAAVPAALAFRAVAEQRSSAAAEWREGSGARRPSRLRVASRHRAAGGGAGPAVAGQGDGQAPHLRGMGGVAMALAAGGRCRGSSSVGAPPPPLVAVMDLLPGQQAPTVGGDGAALDPLR